MSKPSNHLLDLIHADPGIPVPHPTTPMWQVPLHPLAQVSSSSLPKSSDIVVIGSGIAACSVTKGLLEGDPHLKITVLEARSLCSGASSRNGGHITSPSFQDFHVLVKAWGVKTAVEIAEFTMNNVDKTFEAVEALGLQDLTDVSEIRRTQKVHAFRDEATLQKFKEIVALWDKHMPAHRTGKYKILTPEEAREVCFPQSPPLADIC
jgi:glycine/D-amino acid oxidase-like deaminating enzyme